MGFFKDLKNDLAQTVNELSDEAVKAADTSMDDVMVDTLTEEDDLALKAALENADATINNRLTALEGAVDDLTADSVDSRISAAETRAATDATTKANKALADAKEYAKKFPDLTLQEIDYTE